MGMMILARKVGEKVMIGNNITVTVIEVRGDKVRIGVDAPREIRIDRQEIHEENLRRRVIEDK